jgi:hypothetical protein
VFISASPPSVPYLNILTVHSLALHFFHAEIQSTPFITTSVYATPRLYRHIPCGGMSFLLVYMSSEEDG